MPMIGEPDYWDDISKDRENNRFSDPSIVEMRILAIKNNLDLITKRENELQVQDLKDLEASIQKVLEMHRTSAEQTLREILEDVGKYKAGKLTNQEILLKIRQYSIAIDDNIDNWIGWYTREHGF